jgi:YHS domain-containing protein
MRSFLLSILFGLGALTIGGCTPDAPQANDGKFHAECKVCKCNADLGCIDVVVDQKTPHTSYHGKTFYFCSDHCEKAFEKNPAKYEKE